MVVLTRITSGYSSNDVQKAINLYETTRDITDGEIKEARELLGDLRALINGEFIPGIKFNSPIKLDGSDETVMRLGEGYEIFVSEAHSARKHLDIIKQFKPEMERYSDVPIIAYRLIQLSEAEEIMEAALALVKL